MPNRAIDISGPVRAVACGTFLNCPIINKEMSVCQKWNCHSPADPQDPSNKVYAILHAPCSGQTTQTSDLQHCIGMISLYKDVVIRWQFWTVFFFVN